MSVEGQHSKPPLRYTRNDAEALLEEPPTVRVDGTPERSEGGGTRLNGPSGRYRRALELALEIERLLEPGVEAPPSARTPSARIAQGMARSLIDQLAEIARNSA